MVKVLLLWEPAECVKEHFRQELLGWAEPIFPADVSEANLCRLAAGAEVIIGWNPTAKLLQVAPQLKLFVNPGAGVEHQVGRFREFPHVTLVNSHGNAYATAQHGLAMLLTLANRIIPHHTWMVEGLWRTGDKEAKSILLRQKTIGFLGFGAVGQHLARFTSGFELRQIVYKNRPMQEKPAFVDEIYYGDGFSEFLQAADILVVAVPHNKATENLIGFEELNLLGQDGLLLHIARGPVVNESALYQALQEKLIAGAAIDVWYEYNPTPDEKGRKRPYHYPFHELENVVLSPHRADSPDDDTMRWADVITNIRKVYEGRTDYLNIVDLEQGY